MKLKRIILVCLAVLMIFSMCSCAKDKAAQIADMDGVVEMTLWSSEEPYNYYFCLTEDNVLHTVRYRLPKSESGSYAVNDADSEYARRVSAVTLTEEQAAQINAYLEDLDAFCREKGEYFPGPYVAMTYGDRDFHFTYGQCLNRNFDNLTTAFIEYSKIEITDSKGDKIIPVQSADTAEAAE